MSEAPANNVFAAVDLGSNSFHLVVARREHGELRFIDQIKDMVQLASGLDAQGRLDLEVQQRAIDCLARFGQMLRGIPDGNIRAVGTQTFRRMRNANAFLMVAETALGCPVDIIAGREEARLVYLGVSQGVSGHEDQRLVIDIGGGSTELVIGKGQEPIETESLQYGCVSGTRWYFSNGKINRRNWERALRAVLAELQELQSRYRNLGWDTAIGSSGTIRAAADICRERGWSEDSLTPSAVRNLVAELHAAGDIQALDMPSLSDRRRSVFVGGVVMLAACFEALGIERLKISPFALREGVLHDLLGRLEHRDPRDKTVQAFRARYGVDMAQVERVRDVAMAAFNQIAEDSVDHRVMVEMLGWAADLHETGLSVSHSHYQKHSGYLVQESDLAGFSQQEQLFLAIMVRHHRRAIPQNYTGALPTRLHGSLRLLLFCLRFACIICRTRNDSAVPDFRMHRDGRQVFIHVSPEWAMAHPLTLADLEQERTQLKRVGLLLDISLEPATAANA